MCGSVAEWLVKSAAAKAAVTGRKRVALQPAVAPAAGSEAEKLREYLREWRRAMAKERSVPAYIVLHDSSLEEICRRQPKFFAELLEITGIGERKAELYGQEILNALEKFRQGKRAAGAERAAKPADETLRLLSEAIRLSLSIWPALPTSRSNPYSRPSSEPASGILLRAFRAARHPHLGRFRARTLIGSGQYSKCFLPGPSLLFAGSTCVFAGADAYYHRLPATRPRGTPLNRVSAPRWRKPRLEE